MVAAQAEPVEQAGAPRGRRRHGVQGSDVTDR